MSYSKTRIQVMKKVKQICEIAEKNKGCNKIEAFRAIKEKYGASEKMILEFIQDYGFTIRDGFIVKED